MPFLHDKVVTMIVAWKSQRGWVTESMRTGGCSPYVQSLFLERALSSRDVQLILKDIWMLQTTLDAVQDTDEQRALEEDIAGKVTVRTSKSEPSVC